MVEQLVRDSVETSDDASSNATTTKIAHLPRILDFINSSEPSKIKPTSEQVSANSEPSKPKLDTGKAEQEAASPSYLHQALISQ